MRAVLVHVTEQQLADRRAKGLDRWDEMWEGVLHMTPAPSLEHQRMLDAMIAFLLPRVKSTERGTLFSGINVFRGQGMESYRIPDLTFVAAGREQMLHEDGVRGGSPDAVIEIRSPEDETYEKLPFFASIGVREVIVIDRDTKKPELYRLAGPQYVALQEDSDGWLRSETIGVRCRRIDAGRPRLVIEDARDSSVRLEV